MYLFSCLGISSSSCFFRYNLENAKADSEQLSVVLLSLGIQGVQASNHKEATEALKTHREAKICIIDVDDKDSGGIGFLTGLRKREEFRHIKTVVYSFNSSRAFIENLVDLGVCCYLLKPFDQQKAKGKLQSLINRMEEGVSEKRQHIRVTPDPGELLRLHFRISAYANLISGRIRNISMGGLAAELLTPVPESVVRTGLTIPSVNFSLSNKPFSPAAQVVLVKEKLIAMRFESLSADEKSLLARYIYRRMSDAASVE